MKFSELFSGIRIIKELLSFAQISKNESIIERTTDTYENGVLENELNNLAILGKDSDAFLQLDLVKVDTGVAYFNGERIVINDSTIAFDATNISDTTDNGKGTPLSTPHSTGSFDIPITLGSINFLYIAYLLTTDELEFSLHKLTNEKQFYKRTDGFEIQVNIFGVNPDSNRFIFLGQVDATGGTGTVIASNITLVGRDVSRTKTRRIGIETANLSKTDRPLSYPLGNTKLFVDDHIKSVGDGTSTPNNPHAMALSDLGVQPNQTVEEHRKLEHSNGIIAGITGDSFPNGSAMFVLQVLAGGGLQDKVTVKALGAFEVSSVNGIGFGSSVFSSDVDLFFTDDNTSTGTPLPADTYQIVFNSVTEQAEKIQGTSPVTDPAKLWLATVVYDGIDDLVGSALDRRHIGGTSNKLQRWTTAGRPDSSIIVPGNLGFNVDLNQMEYFDGSSWLSV